MTHAVQFALAHGAALLFIWILLQQAGVPIPSAPLLIAVGSLASYGRLRLGPSVVAALTACLLADGFWYRVGRRGGSKSHRFCRPKSDWKNRAVSLIGRHSGASMLLAKFVVGANVVSLLAGQTGLSAARFLIYDSIDSLAWSSSYIALGYFVHGQLHWTLAQTLRPLLGVRAAVFLVRFWRRRSAHAVMLVLATIFFCALQPVSQHNAGIGMTTSMLHDGRRLLEVSVHTLKPFLIVTCTSFWRRFRR